MDSHGTVLLSACRQDPVALLWVDRCCRSQGRSETNLVKSSLQHCAACSDAALDSAHAVLPTSTTSRKSAGCRCFTPRASKIRTLIDSVPGFNKAAQCAQYILTRQGKNVRFVPVQVVPPSTETSSSLCAVFVSGLQKLQVQCSTMPCKKHGRCDQMLRCSPYCFPNHMAYAYPLNQQVAADGEHNQPHPN